jgi:hypothetical protein
MSVTVVRQWNARSAGLEEALDLFIDPCGLESTRLPPRSVTGEATSDGRNPADHTRLVSKSRRYKK